MSRKKNISNMTAQELFERHCENNTMNLKQFIAALSEVFVADYKIEFKQDNCKSDKSLVKLK